MATGISLHIGINQYDTVAYYNDHGLRLCNLAVCCNDAQAYQTIAERFRFKAMPLIIDKAATADALLKLLTAFAGSLQKDDFFMLTFSGHGTNGHGNNGPQAWCLYDQLVTYATLFQYMGQFSPGVRIVVVADCCHAGPMVLQQLPPTGHLQASGLVMAACQSDQLAPVGNNQQLSLYTYWMCQVLRQYEFCDSYRELHNRIARHMPQSAQPSLLPFGPQGMALMRARPFRIEQPNPFGGFGNDTW
jgi:hypothetical protein